MKTLDCGHLLKVSRICTNKHKSIAAISISHFLYFWFGSGYRYTCGCWNLKTYSYTTCDVTVMHDKSSVGLVGRNELNVKDKPYPNLINPNRSPNLLPNTNL